MEYFDDCGLGWLVAIGVFLGIGFAYLTDVTFEYNEWKTTEKNIDSYKFERIDMFNDALFYDDTRDTMIRVDLDTEDCNVFYKEQLVASCLNCTMSHRVAKKLIKKIPDDVDWISRKTAKKEFREKKQ